MPFADVDVWSIHAATETNFMIISDCYPIYSSVGMCNLNSATHANTHPVDGCCSLFLSRQKHKRKRFFNICGAQATLVYMVYILNLIHHF
jgi:hypothetical protein